MNKNIYEDVKGKIITDLDKCNLKKRRMYWRGFIHALSEYCELTTIDYLTLRAVVNRYGNEIKDFQVRGIIIQ